MSRRTGMTSKGVDPGALELGCVGQLAVRRGLETLPIWVVSIAQRILELPRKLVPVCVIPIGWAKGN